ncbi:kinase [Virgibacillus profundi]|uniref:Kinase n=1 Tax=Virgibacillus profundi TaxID=2024555 RepID=A0A2A2ICF0_9BACI|nr:kinase-associated lipoprotein B [Virgibacillus profundi]PAV28753.1 kinase [Virgibacillus profundi]PXY52921.1 kinase [Virgibacillus profundi]
MAEVNIGETVRAHYNSGTYIGEVKEDRGDRYLIKVHAVHKHPLQGDLHNPGEVQGVFFHERKALAHHEKMNVKKPAVHPYDEAIPVYSESLKTAVDKYKEKLSAEDSAFNKQALSKLKDLEEFYERSYY